MQETRSLLDQLEELVNEVIALSNRLARTTEDVRFAQSFHPPSVAAELTESRNVMLALSARLVEVERFLVPTPEPPPEPSVQRPPAASPRDAVSLRPAGPEDGIFEASASLGQGWQAADARLSGLSQLIERALGAENASEAARNLEDLALQYHRQMKFDEAERLYQHALVFREKFFGPGHPSVAAVLDSLAALLQEQGRPEEAGALLRRSSSITEQARELDRPELSRPQESMADAAPKQHAVTQEELLFEQVLAVVGEQATLAATKAGHGDCLESSEEEVAMREPEEKPKVDGNPGAEKAFAAPVGNDEATVHANVRGQTTKPMQRKPAEPGSMQFAPLFVPCEPVQRRTPPAWIWGAVALAVLSVCALFVWRIAGRPSETPPAAVMEPPVAMVDSATAILKFPDLLPDTRVHVDGIPYDLAADGSFQATLSEGDHNVELTRAGYEPKSLSIELKAGQTVTIWGQEVTVDTRIRGR